MGRVGDCGAVLKSAKCPSYLPRSRAGGNQRECFMGWSKSHHRILMIISKCFDPDENDNEKTSPNVCVCRFLQDPKHTLVHYVLFMDMVGRGEWIRPLQREFYLCFYRIQFRASSIGCNPLKYMQGNIAKKCILNKQVKRLKLLHSRWKKNDISVMKSILLAQFNTF